MISDIVLYFTNLSFVLNKFIFDVVSVVNNFNVFSSPLHPCSASVPSNSCNFPLGNIIVK